jgi:hypothetical protein
MLADEERAAEVVRFARGAGPPPSRARGGRAAAVRAAEAAAAEEEYEEEEAEEEAAAAAAFAAAPRGAVVPQPLRRVMPAAPALRRVVVEDPAAYGAAHPAGFEPVHQTEWEAAIVWGDDEAQRAAAAAPAGAAPEEDEGSDEEMAHANGNGPLSLEWRAASSGALAGRGGSTLALAPPRGAPALRRAAGSAAVPAAAVPRSGEVQVVRWEQTLPVTDADAAVPTAAAPKPPVAKPRAHSHPQLLRLRGPATPAPAADAYAGEDAAAASAAAKAAAAAARSALLPRRNPALVSGSWLAEVRWGDDAAPPARPVPLLLDLNDASMTFALRPVPGEATDRAAARVAAAAAAATRLASAVVLPPSLAAYAPSARRRGALAAAAAGAPGGTGAIAYDVTALIAPLNVSKDEEYAARGNDEVQLHRNAQLRPGPLPVQHSLPALKLETSAPYMRTADARSFHTPRAALAPTAVASVRGFGGSGGRITVTILTLRESSGAELKADVSPRDAAESLYALVRRRWPEHAGGGFTLHAARRKRTDPTPPALDPACSLESQDVAAAGCVVLLVGRAITPLPHRIASAVPGPDRPRAPPAAFQSVAEFTARDGHVFVVEYSEQHPLLLSNRGMGARRTCWYRKRSASDTPPAPSACAGADVQALDPTGASPLLCDIALGGRMHALETRMFRAPVWEHPPQDSDFLLIRTATGRWMLRGMTRTAVVGHLEPHPAGVVPAPKNAEVQSFQERRLRLAVFRKLRAARAEGLPECVNLTDLAAEFPYGEQNEAALGKLIKDICKPERSGSRNWVKLPDFDIPSEDALRQLVSPEAVCAYESMQAARERLYDFGVNGVALINPKNSMNAAVNCLSKDPTTRALAAAILLELQLSPWAQTTAFLLAIKGRGTLLLDVSRQGPARRGHIINYALRSVRSSEFDENKRAAPVRLQGTDKDLRKLNMAGLTAELVQLGMKVDDINKLGRWGRVDAIRTLSKGAVMVDGGARQGKWTRHERAGNAVCVRSQRESANKLVARMSRMFGSDAARAAAGDTNGAESASDDDATDSDAEDLARDIEDFLLDAQDANRAAAAAAAKAAAAEKAAEDAEEAAAHLALQRVIHGGSEADPKAGKRMRLVKVVTVIHPGGRADAPVRSVITDPTVLDAYRKARDANGDIVRAVLLAQGPAGKLPYPLSGAQPALVTGRIMKPEQLERRQKEAAKREERKKKEAAEKFSRIQQSGLSATALNGATTGPGGLMLAPEEGVKLKLNFKAAMAVAARLKPDSSILAKKKPWGGGGGRGGRGGKRGRMSDDDEEELPASEDDDEDTADETETDESGEEPDLSGSDSDAAPGGKRKRAPPKRLDPAKARPNAAKRARRDSPSPPPRRAAAAKPAPTSLDALNELLRAAVNRAKRDERYGPFVLPVNPNGIPDYVKQVGGPTACMSLTNMLTRCGSRFYASRAAFLADANKLVNAAYAYNAPRDGRPPGEQAVPDIAPLADEVMDVLTQFLGANKARLETLEAAIAAERAAADETAGADAAAAAAPAAGDAAAAPAVEQPAAGDAPAGDDLDAAMDAALASSGEE